MSSRPDAPLPEVLLYGNGQIARMLFHFMRPTHRVAAFTVDRALITDPAYEGVPIVPFEEIESLYPPGRYPMIIAVGFVDMNRIRAARYAEAKGKGYRFINYIHPSVVIHDNLKLGENTVLLDHVSVHPGTSIGNSTFICSNTNIGHGCRIGDNCWINAGVAIAGETTIGANTFIGINAAIGDNLQVAEACYIGASTLITRNTAPEEVYVSASGERFPLPSDRFLKFIERPRT